MSKNNELVPQKVDDGLGEDQPRKTFFERNWPVILILSVIGFYLFTEHRAHLFGVLPWLILLACPFIHIFMHRGHGGHDHSGHNHKENDDAKS